MPDIAESWTSLFLLEDLVDRGVAVVAGVRGIDVVFCRFDLRGADCGEDGSSGGGLSGREAALRFLDLLEDFAAGVVSGSG